MTRTEFWLLVAVDLAGLALVLAGETAAGLGLIGFGSGYSTRERLQAHRRADLEIHTDTVIQVENEDVATQLRNNTRGLRDQLRAAVVPGLLLATSVLWGGAQLGAQLGAQEPPSTGRVSAGPATILSEKAGVVPAILVEADAPVSLCDRCGEAPLRVLAQLEISGVAGKTVTLDAATFNAAGFDIFLRRRLGRDASGGATYVYLHGGGAVLRDSQGRDPFQRNPLWWSAGVTLERRAGHSFPYRWVSVGLGHSDLSSPPARVPGTLAAAARDAQPRDLLASGSARVEGPKRVDVIISLAVHRGLWGPRATTAVKALTTAAWGK